MYEFLYELLIVNEADISVCSHYIEKPGKRKIKYASDKVLNLIPRDAIRLLVKDDIVRNYLWLTFQYHFPCPIKYSVHNSHILKTSIL